MFYYIIDGIHLTSIYKLFKVDGYTSWELLNIEI